MEFAKWQNTQIIYLVHSIDFFQFFTLYVNILV